MTKKNLVRKKETNISKQLRLNEVREKHFPTLEHGFMVNTRNFINYLT
jgi:hypothetical protein